MTSSLAKFTFARVFQYLGATACVILPSAISAAELTPSQSEQILVNGEILEALAEDTPVGKTGVFFVRDKETFYVCRATVDLEKAKVLMICADSK